MSELSNLTIDVRPGEQLRFDDGRIVLEVLEKSGKAARVRVTEATEATGEVAASHGPIVKLNASALGYDDPMITSPIHSFHPAEIPPFNETLAQGSLNVTYTLIDSGARRERARQSEALEASAGAALSATEQAIAARVAAAYAGALARISDLLVRL